MPKKNQGETEAWFEDNINGQQARFEDKLDGWYKNNQIVSKNASKQKGSKSDRNIPDVDEEWERKNLRFGYGRWTPDFLQVFNTIRWYVVWVCVFSLFQGFIVNGVINAIITTLEKRFDLPSSRSGLIASSNDFLAYFLVLVISFYGSQRHKPRLIACGVLVLGIGSFIFSLPHVATDKYNYGGADLKDFENVCNHGNGTSECESGAERQSTIQNYLYIFILANALHGAGSTPMFTLGASFIDENSEAEQTPFFLGIMYCLASLGVAAGYMGGGQFLSIYTDFDTVSPDQVELTPADPRWVGAWWIPFIISGCVMLFISIPIFGYPRRLPGSSALQLKRKSETLHTKYDSAAEEKDFGKRWKDFPKAMLILLRNPTFIFLTCAVCTDGMIVSGIAAFGTKFLQEKFNLPAAFASFMMGIITVPSAGGGTLLGGFLVKRIKLKCRGIIRMNMIAAFFGLVFGFVFLLQCPVQSIAGISTHYVSGESNDGPIMFDHPCNLDCGCSEQTYEPVCGMDGSIYFTPCHAGCNGDFTMMEGPMGPFKMYLNCSCVAAGMMHKFMTSANNTYDMATSTTALPMTTDSADIANNTGPPIGAYMGICMSECQLLYAVLPILFVGMLLTFLTISPTQTATLRCVHGNERSLAIGVQWLLLRLLGTTPGPIMLGTIMDSACWVWQDVCGLSGSCWIYQKTSMGVMLFVWWCCVKFFCFLFYFLAQYFYKVTEKDDDGDTGSGACNDLSASETRSLTHPVEELECQESVI